MTITTRYLLSKDVYTIGSSSASDSLRHASHASLYIPPCSLLLLQLSHHMVQEHIPLGKTIKSVLLKDMFK